MPPKARPQNTSRTKSKTLSTLNCFSTSNTLETFHNTVYKESIERSKCAGAVSRNDSKRKSANPKPSSNQTDDVSFLDGEYRVPEASDSCDDNDLDEEDQYGYTDDLEICAHYKKQFFTNDANKSCPNGWIDVNYLQPNEDIIGHYQHPQFNPNKVRVGVKLLIPLAHWSYPVECELWIK